MSTEVHEPLELKNSKLTELLSPAMLPEAGFQSYEELKNNATQQKSSFLADEIVNPDLEHPGFHDLSRMDQGILRLANAADKISQLEPDPERSAVMRYSLEFRAAEMGFVKLLGQLEYIAKETKNTEDAKEIAEQARELNEQLYGKPSPEIVSAALNEVWLNLNNKEFSSEARVIYDELVNGFTWGGDRSIAPLAHAENPEVRLPDFNHESIAWAGEHILAENADIEALLYEFWEEKVAEHGEAYVCDPEDIVEAFDRVLDLMDPAHESGVRTILDPNATALSWESPLMAVKVGGKRKPLASQQELFEKVLHELRIHGGRAISGLKTSIPVLGTGLFTPTTRPDYLSFEEGFATTVEEAVSPSEPRWDGSKLGHYLSISMAQDGADFRSVFETSWRYRLLMKLGDGQEVSSSMIDAEKSTTYTACVRVFRGTQTDMSSFAPEIPPMTFNKDLAYLEGRVLAMNHIRELYEKNDIAGLDRLFLAKYDPTNPVQDSLVRAAF